MVKGQVVYVRARYVRKTSDKSGFGHHEVEALDKFGQPTGRYLYADDSEVTTQEEIERVK